jgi:hypothetical protein
MIMNKKIFTLFVGALMAFGSLLTANAQSPYAVYGNKKVNYTSFRDTLRADTAFTFDPQQAEGLGYYVLSVTGIINPQGQTLRPPFGAESLSKSLVLYRTTDGTVRLDTISKLDMDTIGYWGKESKFNLLPNIQWCVKATPSSHYSNVIWDFINQLQAESLEAPLPDYGTWSTTGYDFGTYIKNDAGASYKGIDLTDPEHIWGSWHFSQVYTANQTLQTGMPLYTYYTSDSVLVLCLDGTTPYNPASKVNGGWEVTVKKVAVIDLINGYTGQPITTGTNPVPIQNVLLFTLKKVLPFVMNACDYNSIAETLSFDPDTKAKAKGDEGWNPFTKADATGTNPNAQGTLLAYETNDSLYRYGYLQFRQKSANKWLYVDTAFWNIGNTTYLKFNWSSYQRDTTNTCGVELRADYGLNQCGAYPADAGAKWGYSPNGYSSYYYKGVKARTDVGTLPFTDSTAQCAPKPDSAWYVAPYGYYWYTSGPTLHEVNWRADSFLWELAFGYEELYGQQLWDYASGYYYLALDRGLNVPHPFRFTTGVIDSIFGDGSANSGEAIWDSYVGVVLVNGHPIETYANIYANTGAGSETDDIYTSTPQGIITDIITQTSGAGAVVNDVDYLLYASTDGTLTAAQLKAKVSANYLGALAAVEAWKVDTLKYHWLVRTDSIMQNQSQFRVVYDPWADNAVVNVYQSRVGYTDYTNPTAGVKYPWWYNSFTGNPTAGFTFPTPSVTWNTQIAVGGGYNVANSPFQRSGTAAGIRAGSSTSSATQHSFGDWIYESSPGKQMPVVLISTADTNVFYANSEPLNHLYDTSAWYNENGYAYKDSLLYVDIVNIQTAGLRIATLDQSRPNHNAKITAGFAVKCTPEKEEDVTVVEMPCNLYLIRDEIGRYLQVPIWSITDSVYWRAPEEGEDPTQIPAYQWVIESNRSGANGSFTLTNREFEHVQYSTVVVKKDGKSGFLIYDPGKTSATFAKDVDAVSGKGLVYGKLLPDSIEKGQWPYANEWARDSAVSFIPLAKSVKSDQLLGYTFVPKDSTLVNSYALKYWHFLATGKGKNKYMGWNGYEISDSAVYVDYENYYDKLYFALEEMPDEIAAPAVYAEKTGKYKSIWDKYGYQSEFYTGTTANKIALEAFGYPEAASYDKDGNYTGCIANLKPLARQAYRFKLNDWLKYHPTPKGKYLTVGEQDHYVLCDQVYALKPYVTPVAPATDQIMGVFGVPYFYLRNYYFNRPGYNNTTGEVLPYNEDYFVFVQRVDTVSEIEIWDENNKLIASSGMAQVKEYVYRRFGATAAERIERQVKESRELGAFLGVVYDANAHFDIAVRGDAGIRVSAFTFEKDIDPIYRRFNWNDKQWMSLHPELNYSDDPLTLTLHDYDQKEYWLFENTGADKNEDRPGEAGGGYELNYNEQTADVFKDKYGKTISFLGIKNKDQFPETTDPAGYGNTNYAWYIDTAYINRGTGKIKPQYMLVVDPYRVDKFLACDEYSRRHESPSYLVGRFLFNTAMYAKKIVGGTIYEYTDYKHEHADGSVNIYDYTVPIDETVFNTDAGLQGYGAYGLTGNTDYRSYSGANYTEKKNKWERPALAWAIHAGDTLFVFNNVEPFLAINDPQLLIQKLYESGFASECSGQQYLDFKKLNAACGVKPDPDKIGVQAIIYLGNNAHKDWVWSFRYVERNSDVFVIESETTDRSGTPVIRPGYGAWLTRQNQLITITRDDFRLLMGEAMKVDVKLSDLPPVSNEAVNTSVVKVIGGEKAVTILNAAGKTVVVNNILGQTVAKTTVTSDNATLAVPSGLVIVTVDGEKAVKAIVK